MSDWAENFSYNFLIKLYQKITEKYELNLLRDAPRVIESGRAACFIRHDIDVSLERALEFAIFENENRIKSTYHVMLENPFYDLRKASNLLGELNELGHEVGLHYDVRARKMMTSSTEQRSFDIAKACGELESITGQPVRSVSFHLPIKEFFNGPIFLANRVSSYASDLFKWYLSDSQGRWREGNPMLSLETPRSQILQILVHPIWWGIENKTPKERITQFMEENVQRLEKPYQELDDLMWDHIVFRGEKLNEI